MENEALINCEECGDVYPSDEILHFSPENSSKTLRVCETCYDRLDEEDAKRRSKNFYS